MRELSLYSYILVSVFRISKTEELNLKITVEKVS